jgi:lipoprotein-anchoring transpeptidase ErfK/SrfK
MARQPAAYAAGEDWPEGDEDWPEEVSDDSADDWPDEDQSDVRAAALRRNRRRLALAAVAAIVVGAVVSAGMANTHLLSFRLWPTSPHPSHSAVVYTPPVITLLSPDSPAAVRQDSTSPLGTALPTNVPGVPSQYLAPDQPSDYEMGLIAAIGTPEKVIVVSKFSQTMHVYERGHFVAGTFVITGRPALPTPSGVWHIFYKLAPATLYSPWPPGSDLYYPPTPVNYTMEFREGGFLIHDAPWHHIWGPGANGWHYDPIAREWQWGTHGCITAPTPFIQWLYAWSPDGTTVIVY